MAQIYVKYNPYRLETILKVNNKEISNDSSLYKITKGKRLQEWIGDFPSMLREALNTVDVSLEFCGMSLDWDDFKYSFEQAQREGIVNVSDMRYTAAKEDDKVNEKVVAVFQELKKGPIDAFRSPVLLKAFENINNSIFPISVIATMSSGKSTLINALLGENLMPSLVQACTATITEILDVDKPHFTGVVYNEDGEVVEKYDELTLDIMRKLNGVKIADGEQKETPKPVHRVYAEGDIPFLDCKDTTLMLMDTPGPNNSQNQAHKNTTYRAINNDSNSLILYVLNAGNLGVNDDANLLDYVSEQIKKGGKQVRDRFLFVINKMDTFNPEEESIENVISNVKNYLANHGIEDPQIFPCSAFTALNIRTYFKDIDIDSLTRAEERALPQVAKDTMPMIDKLVCYDSMHLEKYSTLSPSAQQELNYRLSKAVAENDTKEQALIHSGIYSIEAAITAYVKKYAKTKKIKDLVESFQEVLESSQVLTKAKTQVASDEAIAKACAERKAAVEQIIENGEIAADFKKKIDALDPLPKIRKIVDQLKIKATEKSSKVFLYYGDTISDEKEAMRLVRQFTSFNNEAMAELTSELESVVNNEIISAGKQLLSEYQEKLSKFDENSSASQLDFQTFDLIKGELSTIREHAELWTTDEFATETIEDIGETRVVTEKETITEQIEDKEIDEETIRIQKYSVREKVGSHREYVGSHKVVNYDKTSKWQFWKPNYIEVDDYEDVDDFEDVVKEKIVYEYKTVIRNIVKEINVEKEVFSVSVVDIQSGLIAKNQEMLEEGLKNSLEFIEEQIKEIKEQFSRKFDELDELILKKYEELEKCAADETEKEAILTANQDLLNWIEDKMNTISSIIEI